MNNIFVKKLSGTATLPTYGSSGAAGMDLYADASQGEIIIPSNDWVLIKTGISMAIPEGFYGRIAPRSGLAYNYGIDILAGVIDADYRGDIGAILYNNDIHQFVVRHGERIAQLIIEPCVHATLQETKILPSTDRGAGGFGSTGAS